jgi:cytochrome c553
MIWLANEIGKLWLSERDIRANARSRNGGAKRRLNIGPSIAAVLLLLRASFPIEPAAAAGDDQGRRLAAMCASCHRLDGGDTGIPTIVGVGEEKLASALFAYRASESQSHIMHAVALSLSDEEIASVARYLAEQGKSRP